MPITILSALNQLVSNEINMSTEKVSRARASRDWLLNNIKRFEDNKNFLYFYQGFNLHFGSFSRKTKIRPIDDIDLMIGLDGNKLYWNDNIWNYQECSVYLKNGVDAELWKDCLNSDNSLNSTILLNSFKSALSEVPHYDNASIHRMQQAITLKLSSYEWNFDLVPCFHTTSGDYLIPNGSGRWMKTNPKKDRELITKINTKHSGKFLELVRLVKYWNNKSFSYKSKFDSSYLIEVMLANYYNEKPYFDDLEIEFENSLCYLYNNLHSYVKDPKGIEGNLNRLSNEKRQLLKQRIEKDLGEIHFAKSKMKSEKFLHWKNVLGQDFPNYGFK